MIESYEGVQFCRAPEHLAIGRLCAWPNPNITWSITGSLPGFDNLSLKAAYQEAWSYWQAVCGIEPVYTSNARTANVLMGSGHIDGPSGTLAWSELPCGNPRQLEQRYDTGDAWVNSDRQMRGRIDVVRVAAHEIGHVIGIPHIARGNLLQPMYSWSIRTPQAGDIREAQRRYGPPRTAPVPVPVPTPEDPMNPDLKSQLEALLATLAWLAKITPSKIDDNLVAVLNTLVANDWFIQFLSGLFDRLKSGEINRDEFLAAVRAEVNPF